MKHVFIVGCARSGTTWLHLLLAQHPGVATARETHLFNEYLGRLNEKWEQYKSRPATVGLTLLLSEDEFYELCRDFAKKVLQKIADTNPAATVVLEKTPHHVRYAPFILKLIPDAYFIHIVRDPRSVVSSLRAAAHSWGRRWASASVRVNAKLWCSEVTLGREIRHLTERYREIRYEDLRGSDAPQLLKDLFAWLDLPADAAFVARALDACRIDRLRGGGEEARSFASLRPHDPESLRKGTVDGWKEDLSPREIDTVEYIARDFMREYGYPCIRITEERSKKPLQLSLSELFDRLDWRVRATLQKVRSAL